MKTIIPLFLFSHRSQHSPRRHLRLRRRVFHQPALQENSDILREKIIASSRPSCLRPGDATRCRLRCVEVRGTRLNTRETRDAESRSRKPVADLAQAWTPRREKLR
ncbi:unnamed protein product [Brassica rapa]|uniref:Uncharacterized protein n=1 Tax=Brassica campestris TaxID=3711 RepID=A0A3P6B2S9_BRACM|nr:unnamed protein product [Brassica rapa]VDC95319.1 unnamed protein product [Brassica rapa]